MFGEVRRAAGRDDARLEPQRARTLQASSKKRCVFGQDCLGRIEQEAGEAQALARLDEPRQLDRFLRRLDARALAARVALDHDAERAAGDLGRLWQAVDRGRVVGGDGDVRAR